MKDEAELYRAFDPDPAPVVDFLRWLVSMHDLPSPLHVLDVGCGPGRLLPPLAQSGWQVVGMEPNEAFFAHAKTVAEPLDHVEVHRGGFNDLSAAESFDLILGINSTFAHVATPRDRADAFARAFRALRVRTEEASLLLLQSAPGYARLPKRNTVRDTSSRRAENRARQLT